MRCARCGFDTTDLWEVLPQVISLLQREGRVTYRALRQSLYCDDAFFDDLREELLFKKLAIDEDGKGLVWIGGNTTPAPPQPSPSPTAPGQDGPDGPSEPAPPSLSEEPHTHPADQSGCTSRSPGPPSSGSEDTSVPVEARLFDDGQSQPIARQDLRESERELEREPEAGLVSPPTRVLVGRDVEVGLLQLRWEQSREGFGQVVLIGGAAGVGKSRLVEMLSAGVIQEGARCLAFRKRY